MSHPRHVVVLGSTGSIGRQALEVLPAIPRARVVGLSAGSDADSLLTQAQATGVPAVCLYDRAAAGTVAARAPHLSVHAGEAGVGEMIARAAAAAAAEGASLTVLNGIVGAAGLRATLATLASGATLALANKESMVAGGPFVLEAARRSGSLILPVDSEHSALFQCIAAGEAGAAPTGACLGPAERTEARALPEELLLTGSGGPFRGRDAAALADVTPEQALAHPTWSMGPKISIDSATLMNKGLEVIEAHYLFGVPYSRIRVAISPQSIVHSMIRFADGAILAHLGVPDMRTPIGYALAYPDRPALPMVRRLDLFATQLTFEEPDTTTFRCLALAEEAGREAAAAEQAWRSRSTTASARVLPLHSADWTPRTAAAPVVLNAANEVAVERFLAHRLGFPDIPEVVEECVAQLGDQPVTSVDDVFACDAEARRLAAEAAERSR